MAWIFYDAYMKNLFSGEFTAMIDHDADTFKIALVTNSYTPSRAAHDYWDDASPNEVSGNNYTAGGNAIANPAVTVASNTITFDADDPATWAQDAGGFTDARYAILYKASGAAATSNLIAYYDLVSDRGNVDGDLSLELDADGILTLAMA